MSLIGLLKPNGKNGFGYQSTAEEVTAGIDLTGKNILITGCNSGLGLETARVLALRGARILGTSRTVEKTTTALAPLGSAHRGYACELADPKSVQACVQALKRDAIKLDAIICNAGIMEIAKLPTVNGYDAQFFTNHIGHFILVTGIIDLLTPEGRVVMLSSSAHSSAPKGGIDFANLEGSGGNRWNSYGQSKMANLLFAKELARKFAGTERVANAVHPGVIMTNLGRNFPSILTATFAAIGPLFLKNVAQGAATQCYAAVHPEVASINGAYFADVNIAKPRRDAESPETAKKLWQISEKIAASFGADGKSKS